MAVTETALGLKVPDGNDPVRNGDNHIADNARKTQELIQSDRESLDAIRKRVETVESAAFVGGGLLMEDPADPGFFLVGGAA